MRNWDSLLPMQIDFTKNDLAPCTCCCCCNCRCLPTNFVWLCFLASKYAFQQIFLLVCRVCSACLFAFCAYICIIFLYPAGTDSRNALLKSISAFHMEKKSAWLHENSFELNFVILLDFLNMLLSTFIVQLVFIAYVLVEHAGQMRPTYSPLFVVVCCCCQNVCFSFQLLSVFAIFNNDNKLPWDRISHL